MCSGDRCREECGTIKIHLLSLGCAHEVVNVIISEDWANGQDPEGFIPTVSPTQQLPHPPHIQKSEK